MNHVFDYDPLFAEIEKLAAEVSDETQERLMTRIAQTCAYYPEVKSLDMKLIKTPIRNGRGALGIRVFMDQSALNQLRADHRMS